MSQIVKVQNACQKPTYWWSRALDGDLVSELIPNKKFMAYNFLCDQVTELHTLYMATIHDLLAIPISTYKMGIRKIF